MPISTSYTQAMLTALEAAYATGSTSVSYSGGGSSKTVNYRSLSEMRMILQDMRVALGIISQTSVPMIHYAQMERGDE